MRFLGIGIALICLLVGIVYFSTSYQLGRDAEKELEKGNFQEAHTLAMQALEEDPYNRLAFAVANQAKQRLNVQNFLKQSKENQQDAFNILKDGSLSPEEFLRLEWMVEEFNRSYRGLLILNQPNEKEKEQLEQYKLWFENLNQRLNEVKQIKNGQ